MAELRCDQISASYGRGDVLSGVDLVVPDGTLTAILGASGSGKTTLLRVIMGFIAQQHGTVTVGGAVVAQAGGVHLPPEKRSIGYVAQEGALYPHLTVAENVSFGLPRRERKGSARALEVLELVGLAARYAERRPHELSGGEQRRVALARALAPRPPVVLLDEPFSGLDAALRAETRAAVMHALTAQGTTAVLVTHDQAEALSMGREVGVLMAGRLVQTAAPAVLYRAPANLDVARFVGEAVVLPGRAEAGIVSCPLGELSLIDREVEGSVETMIRPEQIRIRRVEPDVEGRARATPGSSAGSARERSMAPTRSSSCSSMASGTDQRASARTRRARSGRTGGAQRGRGGDGLPAPGLAGRRRWVIQAGRPAQRPGLAMRRVRFPGALAIAVTAMILGLALAGCGGDAPANTLVLYSGEHPQLTSALVQAFTRESHIKVSVRTGDGIVLADQILQEGGGSPADVYLTENSPELMNLEAHKLLGEAARRHSRRRSPLACSRPTEHGSASRCGSRVSPTIRRGPRRPQLPRSVLQLGQPSWKGRIAVAPTDSDFPPVVGAVVATYGRSAAAQWLAGIKRNAQIYQDEEAVVAAVNRGDVAAGLVNQYYWYRLRLELGQDGIHSALHYFPNHDPGSIENIAGAAVLASSKHRQAAQRLVQFITSAAGQRIVARGYDFEYPARPEIAPNPALPPLSSISLAALSPAALGTDQTAVQLIEQAGLA